MLHLMLQKQFILPSWTIRNLIKALISIILLNLYLL